MQVQVSLTGSQHCEQADTPISGNDPDWDEEDEYWVQIDDNIALKSSPEANEITDGSKRQRWAAQSHLALIQIVSTLHLHDR